MQGAIRGAFRVPFRLCTSGVSREPLLLQLVAAGALRSAIARGCTDGRPGHHASNFLSVRIKSNIFRPAPSSAPIQAKPTFATSTGDGSVSATPSRITAKSSGRLRASCCESARSSSASIRRHRFALVPAHAVLEVDRRRMPAYAGMSGESRSRSLAHDRREQRPSMKPVHIRMSSMPNQSRAMRCTFSCSVSCRFTITPLTP